MPIIRTGEGNHVAGHRVWESRSFHLATPKSKLEMFRRALGYTSLPGVALCCVGIVLASIGLPAWSQEPIGSAFQGASTWPSSASADADLESGTSLGYAPSGLPIGFEDSTHAIERQREFLPRVVVDNDPWCFQSLPDGLIYRSYWAGVKESRFAAQASYEEDDGWILDLAVGGRVGLFRYGSTDSLRPEGWQLDLEGAALPRLDLEESLDVTAIDFRCGLPITYGVGRYQTKLGYYHLSAHLGDEFMLKNPGVPRINFSRDVIVWGNSFDLTEQLRAYAEAAWAFSANGGSEPWEFQFGFDWSPSKPTRLCPVPFLAVNGHLREEVDFGGNLSLQAGWLWRGISGHVFRMGMLYFNGKSDQFEFFNRDEEKIGLGLWYDY